MASSSLPPAARCGTVSNAVCKEMFEAILADFAKSIGIGNTKRAVLQLDQAGWHGPENLVVPEGIRLGPEGFFARMRKKLQWGDLTDRERR